MLKVLEAIELSSDYLSKKGIEEARLNAELMLADILGMKRLNLYLNFDRPLTENEKELYRQFLARRSKFEPLQYILGYTEFFGLKIFVNQSVLIPRPETELLVEAIINRYKNKEINILDIGTGSGAIAIALAKHLKCKIHAIDVSKPALEIAKYNAEYNSVDEKIEFLEVDILEKNFNLSKYDVIVANPPYVTKKDYVNLQKEILDYEPEIALTDYSDGLRFYIRISNFGLSHLKNNGNLFFEIGKGQEIDIKGIMEKEGYTKIEFIKDYSNIIRIICGEYLCEH